MVFWAVRKKKIFYEFVAMDGDITVIIVHMVVKNRANVMLYANKANM